MSYLQGIRKTNTPGSCIHTNTMFMFLEGDLQA
jgi:hypothetical protein